MKSLLFILLLDYSGSMDQVLNEKPKIQQLKVEVGALMSTAQQSDPAYAIVFGTEPSKKCKDIRILQGTAARVGATLQSLRPGVQGRTPLADALLRTVQLSLKSRSDQVVVVTDGADSCGKNPCQALTKADQELGRAGKKLAIHIVGYDLKSDKGLECLKNLKLKNIALAISEAGNSADLAELLKQSQIHGLNESEIQLSGADKRIKGMKRARVNSGAGGDSKTAKDGENKSKKIEPALLEIVGAPSSAEFQARSGKITKSWKGPYIVSLAQGQYAIRFLDANGAELTLDLPGGTHTRIPWARLFKISGVTLKLEANHLGLKWRPSDQTRLVHGQVDEFETKANLDSADVGIPQVPLGEWEVEVTSPPWLKGLIKAKNVNVTLENRQAEIEKIFEREVIWITNPDPSKPAVLDLFEADAERQRHLIPVGQSRVPVLKDMKYHWLVP
jgi:hypothetical protein